MPVIGNSVYAPFLERWLNVFPPNQLQIKFFEELVEDPFKFTADIEDFVGLPHHDFKSVAYKNKQGLWDWGDSKSSKKEEHPKISDDARRMLEAYFKPYNADLKQ